MKRMIAGALAAGVAFAGLAAAQDLKDPAEQLTARHGYMLMLAMNVSQLGAMAKGDAPYDATAAKVAAANLASLAAMDTSFLWPEGTDSNTLADSSALPEIFANPDQRAEKFAALKTAADAMAAAAGTDVESLKAAMGPLGGACGDCHKTFRKPE